MMNSGFLDFAVNIPKLEHFEGVGFRRWQKKMKFLLAALNVAYVLSTPKPVEQEDETLEATRRRLKWENDDLSPAIRQHGMNMDDSIAIASIIDKLPPSWKKVHRALMQRKEELTMEQLGAHLYVEEGIRQKERKVTKSSKFKKNGKGKGKAYVKCWVCNGPHFKKDCEVWKKRKAQMEGKSSSDHGQTDDSWWVDTGATRHVCKDINLYKVYKSLENGPSLYMGNDFMYAHHLYGIHGYVT
nr:Retrovirus-related Pol polyprotein from transposon TNT 1-94 [Ipomoea batatas]